MPTSRSLAGHFPVPITLCEDENEPLKRKIKELEAKGVPAVQLPGGTFVLEKLRSLCSILDTQDREEAAEENNLYYSGAFFFFVDSL